MLGREKRTAQNAVGYSEEGDSDEREHFVGQRGY